MSYRKVLSIAILLIVFLSTTLLASPWIFPTGVTIYDPVKAYNCYVLFSSPDEKTHLIDMNGNNVREWAYSGQPSEIVDPAVNAGKLGDVLLRIENGAGAFSNKVFGQVDWAGNVVWQWGKNAPRGEAQQHHDFFRLQNGNTLVLSHVKSELYGYDNITDDVIYEVSPQGTVVWKWISVDHIDEFGLSPEGITYLKKRVDKSKEAARPFDYLHINAMHVLGENKWFKAGDKRFHPDNIIFDSRNANFIAIIDKQTGKIVWRLGPDFPESERDRSKNANTKPVTQISGQHDAHFIAEGLPGAGNLLVFDNQGSAGYPPAVVTSSSRVLEIDPITQQVVWEYRGSLSGRTDRSFFSSYISSARRLPNGNTLIDEGMNGRIFQVTPSGEIVWEYINPYIKNKNEGKAVDAYALTAADNVLTSFDNWVYRAQPVPYSWVPEGTPRSEVPVKAVDITQFRVPSAK